MYVLSTLYILKATFKNRFNKNIIKTTIEKFMKKCTIWAIIFLFIQNAHLQSMHPQREPFDSLTGNTISFNTFPYSREQLLQQIQNNIHLPCNTGNSPLHISIIMGFDDIFLSCIIKNINPFAPNDQEDTPLHLAVKHFRNKILKILIPIYNASNINMLNNQGKTALDIACANQNTLAMILLLEYGGMTNKSRIDLNTCHTFLLLHDCAQQGYFNAAKSLLNVGVNVNLQNTFQETALHVAIKNNQRIMIRLLLAAYARTDIQNIHGETAYQLLQKMHDPTFYKMLLYNLSQLSQETAPPAEPPVNHIICTKPNLTHKTPPVDNPNNQQGDHPVDKPSNNANDKPNDHENLFVLHKAITNKETETARALILNPYQNLEIFDENHNTALHLAVLNNNIELVLLLLQNRVLVNIPNILGQTPLHIAAQYGCYEIVKALINAHAFINAKDNDASMPLHYAAYNGDFNTIQFLVMSGASIHHKNNYRVTALDVAKEHDFKEVAHFLRHYEKITINTN
ncbi:MAG: hypothetical protein US69_C0020G0008 [candidate division TM6 bacterium GW2011_GWF2_38_10]|nr:MAG: hypothetical protein US69_C0020G0008 [candidate division TM6 bacterium GW2011_GWF2_38_10]